MPVAFDEILLGKSEICLFGRICKNTPPPCPVVDEDLAEAVAAVLRGRMKQQESHFFACGNSQHLLTGVSETAIIVDRVLRLLSVVRLAAFLRLNRLGIWFIPATWALSVAIEGGVLVLMKRDGGRQNWMAALAANTASYLLLLSISQLL